MEEGAKTLSSLGNVYLIFPSLFNPNPYLGSSPNPSIYPSHAHSSYSKMFVIVGSSLRPIKSCGDFSIGFHGWSHGWINPLRSVIWSIREEAYPLRVARSSSYRWYSCGLLTEYSFLYSRSVLRGSPRTGKRLWEFPVAWNKTNHVLNCIAQQPWNKCQI